MAYRGVMPRALGRARVPNQNEDEGDFDEEEMATTQKCVLFRAEVARRDVLWRGMVVPLRVTTVFLLGLRRVRYELAVLIAAWRDLCALGNAASGIAPLGSTMGSNNTKREPRLRPIYFCAGSRCGRARQQVALRCAS